MRGAQEPCLVPDAYSAATSISLSWLAIQCEIPEIVQSIKMSSLPGFAR